MSKPNMPLLQGAVIAFTVVVSMAASSAAFAQKLPAVSELFEAQKSKVVSIQSEMTPDRSAMPFFGQQGPKSPQMGQGSGFIVDPDGYILTNSHVVEGATQIRVGFQNGDSYPATVVGTDPKIDIAIVKIEAGKKLPSVQLGSSDDLRVGEWVVAIGNPFGLDYSVTTGIVSAKGRNIGAGPYDDFIQTDASINPGNSGGALFNLKGEVVGVNTAIIRDGQGIGFAVPIDMVKSVLPQLRENGYVVRGYIGTGIQDLNEELAESFALPKEHGILISSIADSGPAAGAGLRPGDIITHFDRKRVHTTHELLLAVAEARPGKRARVDFVRGGKDRTSSLTIAERPDAQRPRAVPVQDRKEDANARLGVEVRPVDRNVARTMGLRTTNGLLVERVVQGTPGSKALRPGDVIVTIGDRTMSKTAQLEQVLDNAKSGDVLRMLVVREGSSQFIAIRL